MKRSALLLALLLLPTASLADERVNGYWRDSNGDGYKDQYVDSYRRSERNDIKYDNYSTKGNVNPWTGERGYQSPYDSGSNFSGKLKNRY